MENQKAKHPIIETIAIGFVWIVVLVLSTFGGGTANDPLEAVIASRFFLGGACLAHAVIYGYEAFVTRKHRLLFITNIVSAASLVVVGVLMMTLGQYVVGAVIFGELYLGTAIGRRFVRIFVERKKSQTITGGFVIAFLTLLGVLTPILSKEIALVHLMIALAEMFFALAGIISLAFRRIQLKRLVNIIRKTYAAEVFIGLLMLVFGFSVAFYSFDAEFANYGDALWYSFATVTTIGFGDVTAKEPITRVLSVILGLYGIIVVAVITSVIVNFYSEIKNEPSEEKPVSEEHSGETKDDHEE